MPIGEYYAGESDRTHPWMSPLHGDLRGLPPTLIVVGTAEILLGDARKAQAAGVDVTLNVGEGMVHCFSLFSPLFPEATQPWAKVCAFIQQHAAPARPA
jgi:epsilon-lactone hydrolase